MLALLAAMALSGPVFVAQPRVQLIYAEDFDACSWTGQVLCEPGFCWCGPRVVVLDRFDYRPSEPVTVELTKPEPFGAFPCELHEGSPSVQASPPDAWGAYPP